MTEEGLLFPLGRDAIQIYPNKSVYSLLIESKILQHEMIKEAVIVSKNDAEHDGFEKLYLFVVLEKWCKEEIAIPEIQKHIDCVLLPEERPTKIVVLEKKPIRGFKTDRKYLKETYSL